MSGLRVYIGGLPNGVRERDLERFFKGYGRTCDMFIKNGYGFVEFEDRRDADDAVHELDGKEILGKRVVVEFAKSNPRGRGGGGGRYNDNKSSSSRYGPPVRTGYRLIVENLSSSVSWQDLKDFMRKAGEVTYADAHKERRNEGVVEFASLRDLKTAIEQLDDTDLNGRRVRLVERSRDRRSGGDRGHSPSGNYQSSSHRRGRSRSRSRRSSRGRSRSHHSSRTRLKSHDRSRSRSRSRSNKRRNATKSHSKSHSRSDSPKRTRSKATRESRSGSRSNYRRDSRSNDRSPSVEKRSRSRSPSGSSSSTKNGKA